MSANGLSPDLAIFFSRAPSNRTSARVFFFGLVVVSGFSLQRLFEHGRLSGQVLATYSLQWVVLLGILLALALVQAVILGLLLAGSARAIEPLASRVMHRASRLGYLNLAWFVLPWVGYVLLVLWRYQKQFIDYLPQAWLFSLAVFLGAACLVAAWKKLSLFWAILAAALLYGCGVKALGFFPEVSAYPFTLSWSEASRYYYASLPYAQRLYGTPVPLSSLHPSRYLLLGLPFLFSEAPFWLHRFWQVFLWLALSLGTGMALARRLQLPALVGLMVSAWAFLYVLQGPVYYHLHIAVILVLLGFDRQKFWRTTFFVVLASAWAGISRVNWFPVPALMAAALYFLEQPVCSLRHLPPVRQWLRYLARPFTWGVVGMLAALAAQAGYVFISGHQDASAFSTSFTSALLWYRLLPSPTYTMGVLPTILLVSAPVLVLVIGNWVKGAKDWHILRILGLAGIAGILFAGGLVVSTKIGGGSNIHNLDSFIVILMLVGAYLILGKTATETPVPQPRRWLPAWLVTAVVLVPVLWNLNIGDPFIKRDFKQADYDLAKLAELIEKHAPQGEILFITQRQLIMFGYIPGVKMVPEYELLTLSEMSISHNKEYLSQFYRDLSSHRFALIVADRQSETIKSPLLDSFAEENNAWVKNISTYLTKYYQSEVFFDTQGLDTLVPRK